MMKKVFHLTILVSVLFATVFVSCKKNASAGGKSTELAVEDAKSYVQRLESKYGNYDTIQQNGKTLKNIKRVNFSHAYIGENETSFFVEAPIIYNTRKVTLSTASSIPAASLKKMIANSIDRLVIYKDKRTGLVNEKIVTLIPSEDYLNGVHKDLKNNHYLSMTKDFSGYVTNKDWKGKFLSTQSYNKGVPSTGTATSTKTARTEYYNCSTITICQTILRCQDFDVNGDPVNCEEVEIQSEGTACEYDAITPIQNHAVPIPGPADPYWQGWPDPKNIPSGSSCPTGPRYYESPIAYAAVALDGFTFSVSFDAGCFCYGYSFIILEDVATGTEYSFPIENQNFILPDCDRLWETNTPVPAYVPNGTYYVKTWQDGDVFYHQLEINGVIIRRFTHLLSR